MTLIQTAGLSKIDIFSSSENLQIYNGLDCCLTLEVFEELRRLHNDIPEIYQFEKALQAPYLEIMNRGFRVDQAARVHAAAGLHERQKKLMSILNQLAGAVWDRSEKIKWLDNARMSLNPKSPKQLAEFFYEKMRLPEVWLSFKGVRRLSTNREALEKLEVYQHARPFVSIILAIRDIGKQLEVMETGLDSDGRFRSSYNIAGTETGRPSSSENVFGHGGNAQNIPPGLRYVFTADQGYKLVVIDLEQVEARDVGFICGCLFDDWTFLDNCESGDLHTNNAKLIWKNELPWTGDPKKDKELAETLFYRLYSHRDMSKRGGHLSNYDGTAWTASRALKVPLDIMEEFQARYCRGRYGHKTLPDIEPAFPCIPRWWQWCASELQTTHKMTNLFGRERIFFGRPEADETLREAIANGPQSTTADRTNLGLWKVWKHVPEAQLLAQTYDSITFQVKEGPEFDETVGSALEQMRVELKAPNGRSYVVPAEAKVGWNWGYASFDKATGRVVNPEGLVKWSPGADKRTRATGLERRGW